MSATKRLQRLDPRDELAYYFQILCSVEFRHPPEQTIPKVQELIRKMGPDVHLMYALAKEYIRTDLPELAEGWLIRTLKLYSEHRHAHLSLRQVYRMLGKTEKERDALKDYLSHFPEDYRRKRDLVRILIHLEDYESAGSEIVSLLSRFPRSKALRKNLARCTMKAQKYHEAAVMYRQLLKDEPDSLIYLRSLTYCLEKIGNIDEAIHLLKLAAEYFTGSPSVLLPLGVLYFKSQRYEDAKEIFRKITADHPKDWRAYQNLAVIYKITGQVDMAEKFREAAQRHQPKNS
jgi:tetratricopeptide (TPR) repeat protein